MNEKLEVVILSGTMQPRMKIFGNKATYPVNNRILIHHQVKQIRECCENVDIVVVLGFNADKTYPLLPSNVRIVENQLFNSTNIAEELRIAINNCNTRNILFIQGELYFNKATINNIVKAVSSGDSFLIYNKNAHVNDSVGIVISENYASSLGYGLPNHWTGIGYINNEEIEILQSLLLNRSRRNWYLFELINEAIKKSAKFKCVCPKGLKVIKLDSKSDITKL